MNRKGDIAVTVLIFLIVILLVSSLFVFYFGGSNIEEFSLYPSFKSQSDLDSFKQSMSISFDNALIKTFYEFSLGKEYDYMNGRKSSGEFFNLHSKLNETFSSRFKENLLQEISSYNFSSNYSKDSLEVLKRGDFEVSFNGNTILLNFTIPSSSFNGSFFSSSYTRNQTILISFYNLDLNGFDEIYSAKESCKSVASSSLEGCYEKILLNFDAEIIPLSEGQSRFGLTPISSDKELFIVHLVSKNSFYIDEQKKYIEFVFVGR